MNRSSHTEPDQLYAQPREDVGGFAFDESVARVFPDMIRRSVPGYETLIPMLGVLAGHYARPDSNLYDLGCSLGSAAIAMARRVRHGGCRVVAVDGSPAMIERCRVLLAEQRLPLPVEAVCTDLRDLEVRNATVVVLNFTLQFVPPGDRPDVLGAICAGLLPGGVLLLSEKVVADDAAENALNAELHEAHKRANGYSELEISQKRTALERVLIPETVETHRQRLLQAGFESADLWFRCLNFVSILARKA